MLITLGIIGVVAAMTMPSLMAKHQKQVTVTSLKKAYSVLSQAFVKSQSENGDAAGWVDSSKELTAESKDEYFNKYWSPYFKSFKICTTMEACSYKKEPIYYSGGKSSLAFFGDKSTGILTSDGMYMLFRTARSDIDGNYFMSDTQHIFVDINAAKGPNIYGKDIFLFVLDLHNARILPEGYGLSDSAIDQGCFSDSANYLTTCAARIMKDGWQIKYY